MRIYKLANFIQELEAENCEYSILRPFPDPQVQRGGTCGYYVASNATQYYNKCNHHYPSYFARKKDSEKWGPRATTSLRSKGKEAGIKGVGAIWNVNQFKLFLKDDYMAEVVSFETQEDISRLLRKNLMLNKPIILPVDMIQEKETVGTSDGKLAHYITIIGYYKKADGSLHYIFNSWSYCFHVSEKALFQSCDNLKERPADTYYKRGHDAWSSIKPPLTVGEKYKIYKMPDIDLSGLRNQCILVSPQPFDERLHYKQALIYAIQANPINVEAVKMLIQHGGEIKEHEAKELSLPPIHLHAGLNDEVIEKIIFTILEWKKSLQDNETNTSTKSGDQYLEVMIENILYEPSGIKYTSIHNANKFDVNIAGSFFRNLIDEKDVTMLINYLDKKNNINKTVAVFFTHVNNYYFPHYLYATIAQEPNSMMLTIPVEDIKEITLLQKKRELLIGKTIEANVAREHNAVPLIEHSYIRPFDSMSMNPQQSVEKIKPSIDGRLFSSSKNTESTHVTDTKLTLFTTKEKIDKTPSVKGPPSVPAFNVSAALKKAVAEQKRKKK